MADIRLKLDEVKLCIKNAQLVLHGIRHDATGAIADPIDLARPWSAQQALQGLLNVDGINDQSLNGDPE
jgi:hypothetical protein